MVYHCRLYILIWIFLIELNKLIKKLDKRAEKAEKKTSNSARYALKRRVDSTPSQSRPPRDAPKWAVSEPSRSGSASSSSAAGAEDDSECTNRHEQNNIMTPEAPPGISSNPRRLTGAQAFHSFYQGSSSSSGSDSQNLKACLNWSTWCHTLSIFIITAAGRVCITRMRRLDTRKFKFEPSPSLTRILEIKPLFKG